MQPRMLRTDGKRIIVFDDVAFTSKMRAKAIAALYPLQVTEKSGQILGAQRSVDTCCMTKP